MTGAHIPISLKERNKMCDLIHRKWFMDFINDVGTFQMCSDTQDSTLRDFKTKFFPNDDDYKRSWACVSSVMNSLLQEGIVTFTLVPGIPGYVRCWTKKEKK
jgi:hypothetical protein